MGSRILAIVDTAAALPPPMLEQVPGWFEAWEQALSRFRPDSELSQFNSNSGRELAVSLVLWEVFRIGMQAERLTDGLVTPLVLDALVSAGYDRSFEALFDSAARQLAVPAPQGFSLSSVRFDERRRALALPEGAHLDFGGIAKGWAADQAAWRLSAAGPALVDAGGDIAVTGPRREGQPWPIGVADPFQPEMELEVLRIMRGGVATSGKDYRRWLRNDVLQHHIIDPRTGQPAETDVLTATVIGPSVMAAEAMAKCVLISGSRAGLQRLERESDFAGLLVLDDGRRAYSRNFEQYL